MTPRNTITLSEAQNWAQRWNTEKISFFEEKELKAFKILGSVIKDVTYPTKVVDIRTYFGLDENLKPHLIIVGVDENGDDLIDENNGYYIYNFAGSCPINCSNSSPKINR